MVEGGRKVVEGGRKEVEGGRKVVGGWLKVVGRLGRWSEGGRKWLADGWKWLKVVGRWFWVHKIIFTGGLPPALPGGLPALQTPWRGACSPPCPPAYREAPPLGLSVDLGTKILVPSP